MTNEKIRLVLSLDLTEGQAEALAQMCKRFSLHHATELSNAYDGGREREDMMSAMIALERAMREQGFAPR